MRPLGDVMVLMMPLVISFEDMDTVLRTLFDAIKSLE
jgi:adenosylmethionine-8-amino-7-oxononanoate aminotransferase